MRKIVETISIVQLLTMFNTEDMVLLGKSVGNKHITYAELIG